MNTKDITKKLADAMDYTSDIKNDKNNQSSQNLLDYIVNMNPILKQYNFELIKNNEYRADIILPEILIGLFDYFYIYIYFRKSTYSFGVRWQVNGRQQKDTKNIVFEKELPRQYQS